MLFMGATFAIQFVTGCLMSFNAIKKTVLSQSILTLISISSTSIIVGISTAHAAEEPQQLATIVVEASQQDNNYSGRTLKMAGLSSSDVAALPAAVAIVGRDLIEDSQAKTLADVIKHEASVGENYAPIGYFPNVLSRGFVLDNASSYFVNSQLIRGEQNVALENKQQVEILKGVSAMQAGMTTSGGVINYVTKRPENVSNLSLGVDENGDNSVAVDVGGFVGEQDQFGYRINMANQNIRPYVEHADGDRQFASLALDWNISDQSLLQFDVEAQKQKQRTVAGYQLLDGKVPTGVKWDRLLGYRDDSRAVRNESLNSSLRYQYQFNQDWTGRLSAAHSKVVIEDNSSFAWGCSYSAVCKFDGNGGSFDKNGNYDIYDFRIPDDRYQSNQFKAGLEGNFATGQIQHQLQIELSHTEKKRDLAAGINQWIGTGNIYRDETQAAPATGEEPQTSAAMSFKGGQSAVMLMDQMQWNQQWSTVLGGKWIRLDENTYDATGAQSRKTDLNKFLPQLAIMFNPWERTHFYASYSKGLVDGATAPWYTENASQTLAPMNSRQFEIGMKQQIQDVLLTAALFDLKQDNQSTQQLADKKSYFIQEGQQQNYGLELGLSGKITDALKINTTMAFTQARLTDIGNEQFKGHQLQNIPKFRFSSFAAYDIAAIEGLSVLGGLRYNSSKFANKAGTAKVSGYSVVDLGAAYQFMLSGHDTALRFNVDNVFNKKYWRDVGGYIGDDYMFLGAPRTAKLALDIRF